MTMFSPILEIDTLSLDLLDNGGRGECARAS
jgi:hypothetical protein